MKEPKTEIDSAAQRREKPALPRNERTTLAILSTGVSGSLGHLCGARLFVEGIAQKGEAHLVRRLLPEADPLGRAAGVQRVAGAVVVEGGQVQLGAPGQGHRLLVGVGVL